MNEDRDHAEDLRRPQTVRTLYLADHVLEVVGSEVVVQRVDDDHHLLLLGRTAHTWQDLSFGT